MIVKKPKKNILFCIIMSLSLMIGNQNAAKVAYAQESKSELSVYQENTTDIEWVLPYKNKNPLKVEGVVGSINCITGLQHNVLVSEGYNIPQLSSMEYRYKGSEEWVRSESELASNLISGLYEVRYSETEYFDAGEISVVSVKDQGSPDAVEGGINVITGVTSEMEYKAIDEEEWITITDEESEAGKITKLSPGEYEVRYAARNEMFPSDSAKVLVSARCAPKDVVGGGEEILNVDSTMEYRKFDSERNNEWTAIDVDQQIIQNLIVGKYEVRYCETEEMLPSETIIVYVLGIVRDSTGEEMIYEEKNGIKGPITPVLLLQEQANFEPETITTDVNDTKNDSMPNNDSENIDSENSEVLCSDVENNNGISNQEIEIAIIENKIAEENKTDYTENETVDDVLKTEHISVQKEEVIVEKEMVSAQLEEDEKSIEVLTKTGVSTRWIICFVVAISIIPILLVNIDKNLH